jgi:hypothetical protein
MSMIEHGLLPETKDDRRRGNHSPGLLRGGLITAFTGMAITVGLFNLGDLLPPPFNAVPGRVGPWLLPGLIPTAVGIALVASYYLAPPRVPPVESDSAATPDPDVSENRAAGGPHLLHEHERDRDGDFPSQRNA